MLTTTRVFATGAIQYCNQSIWIVAIGIWLVQSLLSLLLWTFSPDGCERNHRKHIVHTCSLLLCNSLYNSGHSLQPPCLKLRLLVTTQVDSSASFSEVLQNLSNAASVLSETWGGGAVLPLPVWWCCSTHGASVLTDFPGLVCSINLCWFWAIPFGYYSYKIMSPLVQFSW